MNLVFPPFTIHTRTDCKYTSNKANLSKFRKRLVMSSRISDGWGEIEIHLG